MFPYENPVHTSPPCVPHPPNTVWWAVQTARLVIMQTQIVTATHVFAFWTSPIGPLTCLVSLTTADAAPNTRHCVALCSLLVCCSSTYSAMRLVYRDPCNLKWHLWKYQYESESKSVRYLQRWWRNWSCYWRLGSQLEVGDEWKFDC
jgi:hypothetical protein